MNKQSNISGILRKLPVWYYVAAIFLIILSLGSFTKKDNGKWELTLGMREATSIVIALALSPILLGALSNYRGPGVKIPGLEITPKEKIDKRIDSAEQQHSRMSGLGLKDTIESIEEILSKQEAADRNVFESIQPGEIPIVRELYLQELQQLIREFNLNRNLPDAIGYQHTLEGDQIASRIRAVAPLLFRQIDVPQWLNSKNPGKRLAAAKYLDWAQDIDFFEELLNIILKEQSFIQFHIGIAIHNMVDQLTEEQKELLKSKFRWYKPPHGSNREFWKNRIEQKLSD